MESETVRVESGVRPIQSSDSFANIWTESVVSSLPICEHGLAARVLRLLEPIRRGNVRDGELREPIVRRALRGIRTFRALVGVERPDDARWLVADGHFVVQRPDALPERVLEVEGIEADLAAGGGAAFDSHLDGGIDHERPEIGCPGEADALARKCVGRHGDGSPDADSSGLAAEQPHVGSCHGEAGGLQVPGTDRGNVPDVATLDEDVRRTLPGAVDLDPGGFGAPAATTATDAPDLHAPSCHTADHVETDPVRVVAGTLDVRDLTVLDQKIACHDQRYVHGRGGA